MNKHFNRLITGSVALSAIFVVMIVLVMFIMFLTVAITNMETETAFKIAIFTPLLLIVSYALGREILNLQKYRKSKSDLHFTKDGVPYREPSEILKRPKVKETLNKMKQRGVIK